MGYTRHNYYVHQAGVLKFVLGEIILKLCGIMWYYVVLNYDHSSRFMYTMPGFKKKLF